MANQVNQPTGSQVETSPQIPSKTATGTTQLPTVITAKAMAVMINGTPRRTRFRCRPTSVPTTIVPTSPAAPIISSRSESLGTSTCVTVSRKGRR
ncbi:hypothetical protein D3C79_806150 [compost metagenome]